MAHNTLHSRSYLTHTNFRDQPDEYEPLDVFTEGDEDGYVWPSEPVLPLDDTSEAEEREALRRLFEDWEEAAARVERAERETA